MGKGDGTMHVNPYLTFNGNCKEAFEFYEKAFGTKITFLMKNGDSPMADQGPAGWNDKVLHVAIKIGETMVFGSDTLPAHYRTPAGMSVSVDVKTVPEAEQIFAALSEDALITMPLQEVFWAQRFGMLTDRFGTPWMLNCEMPMP